MKFVMTQAVCPEGMELLKDTADIYVADDQDPNNLSLIHISEPTRH